MDDCAPHALPLRLTDTRPTVALTCSRTPPWIPAPAPRRRPHTRALRMSTTVWPGRASNLGLYLTTQGHQNSGLEFLTSLASSPMMKPMMPGPFNCHIPDDFRIVRCLYGPRCTAHDLCPVGHVCSLAYPGHFRPSTWLARLISQTVKVKCRCVCYEFDVWDLRQVK